MKIHVVLLVLAWIACPPVFAVEKCLKNGKVIYTDQSCDSLGAQIQKSFVPPDNTVMSAKTQYLRYKVATGQLTGTTTTTYADGRKETRPVRPEDIDSKLAQNMAYPSEPPTPSAQPLTAPMANNNQVACEQVNRQLEENAWNARQRHVAEAQDYLSDVRRKLWDESRRLKCGNP